MGAFTPTPMYPFFSGPGGGTLLFWSLHWLFMATVGAGLVLGVIWIARAASQGALRIWILVLIVVGAVGAALTIPGAVAGSRWMRSESGGSVEGQQQVLNTLLRTVQQRMEQHEWAPSDADHREMDGMMRMMLRASDALH